MTNFYLERFQALTRAVIGALPLPVFHRLVHSTNSVLKIVTKALNYNYGFAKSAVHSDRV